MRKVKFEKAVSEYLYENKLRLKPNSFRSLSNRLTIHILPYFKKKNIHKLSKKDYIYWKTMIDNKNYSVAYKRNLHICFVTFLNYCMINYDLKENIAQIVGNFRDVDYHKNDGNVWTIEEFNQFISVVDDLIYKALFEFLYFTGARLGEALALTFNDINIESNTININKNMTRFVDKNGNHIVVNPKSKSSCRIIGIDDIMKNRLLSLKKLYSNFDNNFLVFGGNRSLSTTTIERKKNYYCMLSNVHQIKIHEFRHSHACLLFQNDVPINQISNRLGHSTISMTMDIYLRFIPKDEKRVLQTLNSIHK